MIKPIESLTDDLSTIPGHNTDEKDQLDGNDSLLQVITSSETNETVEQNVTTCNTGIDVSNVNTDPDRGNIDNSSDRVRSSEADSGGENTETQHEDDDNASSNETECYTIDEKPTDKRKRITRNVNKVTTYKTKDENGSSGELNIQFRGRPKYRRKRKYTCTPCNKGFPNQREFNQHYIDEHGKLHCNVCGKPFHTPSALRKHEYEHKDVKIPCTKCEKVFPFQSQLDSHMIMHRDLATFKCMVKGCTKWFNNKGDLTKHLKKHTGKIYTCKHCEYTANCPENLKGHSMKHSNLKRYVCLLCGTGFRWSQERKRHLVKCPKK